MRRGHYSEVAANRGFTVTKFTFYLSWIQACIESNVLGCMLKFYTNYNLGNTSSLAKTIMKTTMY